jgi:hypothetical protein
MYDCSKDIMAYHDDQVTLPQPERDEMRKRRDTNRKRLKDGLAKAKKPAPLDFKSQGSYAMRTMTQHPEKDYDVDDGVYFKKEDLTGERGAELSSLQARQRVRDAVHDDSFTRPPEARENCVRVFYNEGFHVDLPVYRRVVVKTVFGELEHYELAGAEWKRSDARDVTTWFEKENDQQSPDTENGRQLRRVTRLLKKFAKSRLSWELLSGFGITKLVTERYRGNASREDKALYDTMKAIRDRLAYNLEVQHPCTEGGTITKGSNDPKARRLREKLDEALEWLKPLFDSDCTHEEALKCWGKVFNNTEYFNERIEEQARAAAGFPAPAVHIRERLEKEASSTGAREAVRKEGGGRYA